MRELERGSHGEGALEGCSQLNPIPLSASQMQLLDKFPIEGGQKDPKQRIIPFLPGKLWRGMVQGNF